jgi:hypothetical protein
MARFDPAKDLRTELDERGLGRRVTCLVCDQIVFQLPPNPTDEERLREGKGLAAHLEFAHDMVVFYGRCPDRACKKFHLSTFDKDKLPAEFKGMRNPW